MPLSTLAHIPPIPFARLNIQQRRFLRHATGNKCVANWLSVVMSPDARRRCNIRYMNATRIKCSESLYSSRYDSKNNNDAQQISYPIESILNLARQ
ncbi:MAG: hypothetical protein CM15mP120_30630 [Pseudomonadota bacterium]|nr:MAG: hypothetical protein CM15mP120_30630 [Pseudomonadota bacterium]